MTAEGIYSAVRRVQNLFRYGSYWHPVRIGIEVVSACNRHCHYCVSTHISAGSVTYVTQHDSVFRLFLDRLYEHRWNGMVVYNGFGEPLLHPHLSSLVRRTKDTRPRCKPTVYTNGDRLNEHNARELIEAGAWRIIVTRHSPFRADWDARMVELLQTFPRHIVVRTIQLQQLVNFGGRLNMVALPRKRCHIPSEGIVIWQNGDAAFCCCAPKDDPKTIAGNIARHSFQQIWNNHAFAVIRREVAGGVTSMSLCKACMAGRVDNKA